MNESCNWVGYSKHGTKPILVLLTEISDKNYLQFKIYETTRTESYLFFFFFLFDHRRNVGQDNIPGICLPVYFFPISRKSLTNPIRILIIVFKADYAFLSVLIIFLNKNCLSLHHQLLFFFFFFIFIFNIFWDG